MLYFKHVYMLLVVLLSFSGIELISFYKVGLTLYITSSAIFIPAFFINYTVNNNIRIKIRVLYTGILVYCSAIFLMNIGSSKVISLIYSFILVMLFNIIMKTIDYVERKQAASVFYFVFVAYCCNVIITFALVKAGILDENSSSILRVEFDKRVTSYRPYGFSTEPSYAAFITILSYYVWYKLRDHLPIRTFIGSTCLLVFSIFLMGSMYGMLLLGLLFMFLVYNNNIISRFPLLTGAIVMGLLATAFYIVSTNERLEGIVANLPNLFKFDESSVISVDGSMFIRLFPVFDYLSTFDLKNLSVILGHGSASSTNYYTELMFKMLNPDSKTGTISPAFFPSFFYDYGLVGAVIFIVTFFKTTFSRDYFLGFLFFFLVLFNSNFNTQLFWFVIVSISTLKHFSVSGAGG